eukprot:Anaeramoba_flamelloidesc42706_g1_i1.p1 GENE.c42706_g1_i1~~c42706_g1_i1.p1  ORF type:complete len:330 (+),score=132.91 c42706_g1_i1:3-992(+)
MGGMGGMRRMNTTQRTQFQTQENNETTFNSGITEVLSSEEEEIQETKQTEKKEEIKKKETNNEENEIEELSSGIEELSSDIEEIEEIKEIEEIEEIKEKKEVKSGDLNKNKGSRIKMIETDPKFMGEKRYLTLFDDEFMEKSHMELMNMNLSKLDHSKMSFWKTLDDPDDGAEIEESEKGGFWYHYFTYENYDFIWRTVLQSFVGKKKAFGEMIQFQSNLTFDMQEDESVVLQMFVKDANDLSEIIKIGKEMLNTIRPEGPIYFCKNSSKRLAFEDKEERDKDSINKLLGRKRRNQENNKNASLLFKFYQRDDIEEKENISWTELEIFL